MSLPTYPPKVTATIVAFETGRSRREPKRDGQEVRPVVSQADMRAELEQDFWRSLMDNADPVGARA